MWVRMMSKQFSIAQARDNLAAIVHELERIDRIEITRRGQPVAVLISKREYDRLQARSTGFWDAYKAFANDVNLNELNIDPAEVFAGLRDRAAGREIEL
jgi:prevent-host-death family protein